MTARLTRRERAAMQLALEALRADGPPETVLTDALVVLGVAEDGGARLCGAIEIAAQRARWQLAPAHGMWRHPCADGRPADLPRGEACGVCGASEPRRARR